MNNEIHEMSLHGLKTVRYVGLKALKTYLFLPSGLIQIKKPINICKTRVFYKNEMDHCKVLACQFQMLIKLLICC